MNTMKVGDLKVGYYKLKFDSFMESNHKFVQVVKVDKNAIGDFGKKRGSTAIINHSTENKLLIWLWHDTLVHDVSEATKKDIPK